MKRAHYFIPAAGGLFCTLCPHACRIAPGGRGICRARENRDGELIAVHYGFVSSLALDPIEKKPLRRFHPGTQILSLGGYGCNLRCPFCQNHGISLEYDSEDGETLSPEDVLDMARRTLPQGNIGLAYTYNEPLINYEFVHDCARLIHAAGLKNVLVTNGYINREPLLALMPYIDAMNIDLKAFSEDFYARLGGRLDPVLHTIRLAHEHCHVEVTTLVIEGENDGDIEEIASWLADLSPDIPLHLPPFYPRYQYADKAATRPQTLRRLREVARAHMNHVY